MWDYNAQNMATDCPVGARHTESMFDTCWRMGHVGEPLGTLEDTWEGSLEEVECKLGST